MCGIPVGDPSSRRHLELAYQLEGLVALCNFFRRECAQALKTKRFHAKTSQNASVNHRSSQIVEMHFFHRARQIARHSTGKCIPCPGGIVNVFKWIGATAEKLVAFAKKQCAMLAFFYRDVIWTHLSNATSRLDKTCLLGDFARLAVV